MFHHYSEVLSFYIQSPFWSTFLFVFSLLILLTPNHGPMIERKCCLQRKIAATIMLSGVQFTGTTDVMSQYHLR